MSAAEQVYVPRLLLDASPVFHERGGYRRLSLEADGAEGDEVFTLCGIVVYSWVGHHQRVDASRLRRDHAGRIGRACRSCWRIDALQKGYRP